jgi:hypothetical protein
VVQTPFLGGCQGSAGADAGKECGSEDWWFKRHFSAGAKVVRPSGGGQGIWVADGHVVTGHRHDRAGPLAAGPRGWRGQPVAYPTPLLLAGAGGGGSEWGVEALEANATIVGGTSQDRLQGAIDVGEPDLDQTRGA